MACYSCHADYTIYGPLNGQAARAEADLHAIREHAAGSGVDPHSGGFKNAQCLHCHLGARNFEENAVHAALLDSLSRSRLPA